MNSLNIRVIFLSLIVSSLALVHASSRAPTPKAPKVTTMAKTIFFRGLSTAMVAESVSSPSPALSRFEEAVYGMKDPSVNSPLPAEYKSFFEEEHCLEEESSFFQQNETPELPVDLGSALHDGLCVDGDGSCNRAALLRILSYLIEKQTNKSLKDAHGRTLLDLCTCCSYESGIEQLEQVAVDATVGITTGGKKVVVASSASTTTRAASAIESQPSVYRQAHARPVSQPVRAVAEFDLLGDAKDDKIAALEKVIEMLKQNLAEERSARLAVLKKQDDIDKLTSQNELLIKQLMKEKKGLQVELHEHGDCIRNLQKYNMVLEDELKKQQAVINELQLDLATQRSFAQSLPFAATSGSMANVGTSMSNASVFAADSVVTVDTSALSQAAASSSSAALSETPVEPTLATVHPISPAAIPSSLMVSPTSPAAPPTSPRS